MKRQQVLVKQKAKGEEECWKCERLGGSDHRRGQRARAGRGHPLIKSGGRVVLADVAEGALGTRAAAGLAADGGKVAALVCDVTREAD